MKSIYLDYMATTPVDPKVLTAMLPYFTEHFGNPSALNAWGKTAREAVELARTQIAQALVTQPECLTFTSGATEADNLAIFGLAAKLPANKRHILTLATEHKSVLAPCERLEQQGYQVTYLKPMSNGIVDPEAFAKALREDTGLVSVLWVNNEIGVIQQIETLRDLARQRGAYVHVDAVQALGKIPVDLTALDADAVVLSGHKVYGPKGIGALWLRQGLADKVQPMCIGGGQEHGMRSGTLAVPLIVGMGKACELAVKRQGQDYQHVKQLRDGFLAGLSKLSGWDINGDLERRIPHNINMSFEGIDSETLRLAVPELSMSAGSACHVGQMHASHVLKALDLPIRRCQGAVRISFGRHTTMEDIAFATDTLVNAVNHLRG